MLLCFGLGTLSLLSVSTAARLTVDLLAVDPMRRGKVWSFLHPGRRNQSFESLLTTVVLRQWDSHQLPGQETFMN